TRRLGWRVTTWHSGPFVDDCRNKSATGVASRGSSSASDTASWLLSIHSWNRAPATGGVGNVTGMVEALSGWRSSCFIAVLSIQYACPDTKPVYCHGRSRGNRKPIFFRARSELTQRGGLILAS